METLPKQIYSFLRQALLKAIRFFVKRGSFSNGNVDSPISTPKCLSRANNKPNTTMKESAS